MKKLVTLVLAAMMVVSLSACATHAKKKTIHVKCPACGYEFDVPVQGPGQ